MRIGMVSKFHAADGLCVRATYVVDGLRRNGHTVHAFTHSDDVGCLPSDHVHRYGGIQLNPHVSLDVPSAPKMIVEKSRENDIEIIHVQMNSGSTEFLLPYFRNSLPPTVVTFHLAYAEGSTLYKTVFGVAWRLSLHAARQYDHVVLVDPVQKAYFMHFGVPEEKLTVIRNGVDTDLFTPPRNRPDDGIVDFVFVGRLSYDKGVDILLDAFRRYHSENRHTRLTLIGDGILKHTIDDDNDDGAIRWVGTVPHYRVPQLLQRADVFVIPQNIGGLGLSVLEAMSCGLPVITTAIGETKRLLGEDEGVLVEPHSVDAVVDAMRVLAEDEQMRRRMGLRCRQKIEREYSWAHQIGQLERVYNTVVSEARN